MKKYFMILMALPYLSLYAQTVDVVTNLSGPWDLLIENNTLYFSENNANKVSMLDLTQSNPIATDVVTNLNGASGIEKQGDTLYVGERLGSDVVRFDLNLANPTPTTVVTLNAGKAVSGLHLDGTGLFIAERAGDSLWVIESTAPVATKSLVIDGLDWAYGMARHGDDLYIANWNSGKLVKVDLTSPMPILTDVVTGLYGPIGLLVDGDNLFISEHDSDMVSMIDLSAASPILITVATGVDGPFGLEKHNGELYIAEYFGNKISKIGLPMNTNTISSDHNIELFPNPSPGQLELDLGRTLNSVAITLTDLNGRVVQFEEYQNCSIINYSLNQVPGMYILNISYENQSTFFRVVRE